MVKPGFKQTEIGEIPEEWEVAKLGDLCNIQVGKTPSREIKEYWDKEKTTRNIWVSIADMLGNKIIKDTNEYISDKAIADTRIKRVSAGTLLMSFKLTVGRMAFAGVDLFTNEAIAALAPRDSNSISTNYLYYAIEQARPESYCDPAVKGKTLNQPKIKSILLPLPPLPEQKKIASVLSTVDAAIEKTSEIIEQSKQLKKGLMQELLTRGIGHKKFKQTEIGEIPEEWEIVTIGDIAKIRRGASPRPIGDPKFFAGTGRGWVRISDVTNSYKYLKKTSQYLSPLGESRSVPVNRGDLIVSICATIGKPIIVDIPVCIHDGFVLVESDTNKIQTDFAYYLFELFGAGLAIKGQYGTQGNLNTSIVKSMQIPLSPLPEQKKIAEILGAADAKIEAEAQKREQLQTLKKGLMQDLLTGRVRFPEFIKGGVNA